MSSDTPEATVQYRLKLAHALHSISPTLSALHTSRAAALHPDISAVLQPSHCPKCGTYRFSGDQPSSPVGPSTRKKRRRTTSSHPKALHRRCNICGFSIDAPTSLPLDHFSVPNGKLSKMRPAPAISRIKEKPRSNNTPRPIVTTGTPVETTKCMPILPLPRQQSHPKFKTSTLKDMLSRDRQREGEKSQKVKNESHQGLAAFLKQL